MYVEKIYNWPLHCHCSSPNEFAFILLDPTTISIFCIILITIILNGTTQFDEITMCMPKWSFFMFGALE